MLLKIPLMPQNQNFRCNSLGIIKITQDYCPGMSWLKRNSLILLIMIALFMGWLTPDWGAKNGYLQSQFFIKAGVILIFFLQGFSLSTKTMIEGLKFWPLHLFTQFWIFIGIPAIALIGHPSIAIPVRLV